MMNSAARFFSGKILLNMCWMTLWLFVSASYAETIIIGTAADNPPLSYQAGQNNNFAGFEVDITRELCNRLQLTCQYRPVIVNQIVPEIINGKIDFAIAALIFPSSPISGLIFSLPYLQSGGLFMTLKDSTIKLPNDLRNKTIGVRLGTLGNGLIFKDLIMQIYNNQLKVVEYPAMNNLLTALNNRDVDAIFTNESAIKYWYYNNKNIYKLIGSDIPVGNGYALMTSTKNQALMARINQALLEMMADGTYLQLYNNYFSAIK